MKSLIFTTIAICASSVLGIRNNYQQDFDAVDAQLWEFTNSLNSIQSVAESLRHSAISKKCKEARAYTVAASSAWSSLTVAFYLAPWKTKSSIHATTVKNNLDACNTILQAISQHSLVLNNPKPYRIPISKCRTSLNRCQTGCSSIFNWSPPSYQPPQPKPSQSYGGGGYKRVYKRDTALCPLKETACPISSTSDGFECLDVESEISSCGGCVSMGEGENCLAIPGAAGVGCENGLCVVFSVKEGFVQDSDGRPVLA